MTLESLILPVLILAFVFGCLGSWIASQKNRGGGEGFWLGFLFGPFGVLIEALLPTIAPPVAVSPPKLSEVEEKWRAADLEHGRQLAARRKEMPDWAKMVAVWLVVCGVFILFLWLFAG